MAVLYPYFAIKAYLDFLFCNFPPHSLLIWIITTPVPMTKFSPSDDIVKNQGAVKELAKFLSVKNILLKTGPLQDTIFNSTNFSSIANNAKGVIQIF